MDTSIDRNRYKLDGILDCGGFGSDSGSSKNIVSLIFEFKISTNSKKKGSNHTMILAN